MELGGQRAKCLAVLFLIVACVQSGFVDPPEPDISLLSMTEGQTRLPCHYQVGERERVVQVTWYKVLADGSKDHIIMAHFTDGHTEFRRYSGRMKFESSSPTEDSALLIPSTAGSDEGIYTCHISTFPNGNFERRITLTVWILPISSLEPVILVEGQSFRVAAACRAVGRPLPRLSWDTDLPGQSQNRTNEGGSVSSYYSLHPLRSMNGKKLDCLVWHPGLEGPRRISHRVEVQYPPDATISAASGDLYVGQEEAELVCDSRGHPKPQNITWTWRGGPLPDGVSAVGGKLVFGRALRMNDSGVFECVVKNSVGVGKTEYEVSVTEKSQRKGDSPGDNLLLIIICTSAGVLVMVLVIVVLLVNRYHRNRNKKLEMELSEKTEEINSFSRQASIRRLNSVSTDPRVPADDYRVDSRMKHSQMSLERAIYKGSQSTLGGKYDELGRPAIWHPGRESLRGADTDREKEEHRRRMELFLKSSNVSLEQPIYKDSQWDRPGEQGYDTVGRPLIWQEGMESLRGAEVDGEKGERRRVESNLKSSNMSLDSGLPSSLIPLKVQPDDSAGPREPDLGHLREGDSAHEEDWAPARSAEEEQEDNDGSSSHQISAALNTHFYFSKGVLRPKPHSNAILLHQRPQVI